MKVDVGFLHAGEGSRDATASALAWRGKAGEVVHLVDDALVDAQAASFPITDERYARIRERARELSKRAEKIVLTCSVYNGVAGWLSDDLGIPVERSDAAGTRALLHTSGNVGLLVSYAPTKPVVEDYVCEILAQAEQSREIHTSIADAPPFTTTPERYRDALVRAIASLQGCGVLFATQYTMSPHLEVLRSVWDRPLISALDATIDAFFPIG